MHSNEGSTRSFPRFSLCLVFSDLRVSGSINGNERSKVSRVTREKPWTVASRGNPRAPARLRQRYRVHWSSTWLACLHRAGTCRGRTPHLAGLPSPRTNTGLPHAGELSLLRNGKRTRFVTSRPAVDRTRVCARPVFA